jgi:hypothetical protein
MIFLTPSLASRWGGLGWGLRFCQSYFPHPSPPQREAREGIRKTALLSAYMPTTALLFKEMPLDASLPNTQRLGRTVCWNKSF